MLLGEASDRAKIFSDLENIFSVIMGHTLDRKLTSLMAKSLVHGY